MDTKKQRQCRRDDMRLTESGNASFSWYLQSRYPTENDMAASRALEWIGASKARLVFRYEISDLFLKAQTTQQQIKFQQYNEYLASQ